MFALGLLATTLLGVAEPADSWRLPVIKKVADFTLTDQSGKPFTLRAARGKVLLVGFIFTTCNGTCPATTHRMAVVQRELQQRGLLKTDKVHFLSITLDPARDTPEALRHYMRLYDIDAAHWTFLTGPAANVGKVHATWGMWTRATENGQLDHPSRVFLVDARGQLREVYNLDFLRAPWVADDVERLLQE